jgi:hypothetical protein
MSLYVLRLRDGNCIVADAPSGRKPENEPHRCQGRLGNVFRLDKAGREKLRSIDRSLILGQTAPGKLHQGLAEIALKFLFYLRSGLGNDYAVLSI